MSESFPQPPALPEQHELAPQPEPAIYVVSMEDYRRGREVADWISATQDHKGMDEDKNKILASSLVPGATEWAVHDETGFYGLVVGDLPLDQISRLGRGIAEHGEAFARWIGLNRTEYVHDSADMFTTAYVGSYESLEDFAARHLGRAPGLPITRIMRKNLEKKYLFVPHGSGVFAYHGAM